MCKESVPYLPYHGCAAVKRYFSFCFVIINYINNKINPFGAGSQVYNMLMQIISFKISFCSFFSPQGRQLRGFRGLFNKSSKSSVDTNIGVPPRKRSITDHLLRRTASAPAKGRKKTKMPVAEALHERKLSTGDSQPTDVERRTDNRKTLQHRPVSMPMEKLLHSKLNLTSTDQEGTDTGADTITGQ